MINEDYWEHLPKDVVPLLKELYGSDEDTLSHVVRAIYYLYVQDRVPVTQWTHQTFFLMAAQRGWSDPHTRRIWAQFHRVLIRLRESQDPPVVIRKLAGRGTIRISTGNAPWILVLHCEGYDDVAQLSKELEVLRTDGWSLTITPPEDEPQTTQVVTVKKARPNTKVTVEDLTRLLMRELRMTQETIDPKTLGASALAAKPIPDFAEIRKALALVCQDWHRYQNWVELLRHIYGSAPIPPSPTLRRIYELTVFESAPQGFHGLVNRLNELMKDLGEVNRGRNGYIDWPQYQLLAQREPMLHSLWGDLEVELIRAILSRFQALTKESQAVDTASSAEANPMKVWMEQVGGRFADLRLVGEVQEERAKSRREADDAGKWIDWQATRRLIQLGEASAIDAILADNLAPWLSEDAETCVQALELAAENSKYDAVLTLRDMLPFDCSQAVHQYAAQALVAQGQDSRALIELQSVAEDTLDEVSVRALATALIRLGKHEQALPLARKAVAHGWIGSPGSVDMVDQLILTGSLARSDLLDFCQTVINQVTSFSEGVLVESAFSTRIESLFDTVGHDPDAALDACVEWADVLIGAGSHFQAWQEYQRIAPKLKDTFRLRWLDSLASDVPEALDEVVQIGWKATNQPLIATQAKAILRAYNVENDLLKEDEDPTTTIASIHHYSLVLAGALKSIRSQVRKRLVETYGFEDADISEVPSPWEGHTATTEIRKLVDTHDLVVAYTAMMKHSLWHQLDVPIEKVLYPPSAGVTGTLQVILDRCAIVERSS